MVGGGGSAPVHLQAAFWVAAASVWRTWGAAIAFLAVRIMIKTKLPPELIRLVRECKKEIRTRQTVAGDVEYLLALYRVRRWAIDPMWRPGHKSTSDLARAVGLLRGSSVCQARWGLYLDWLFDRMPAITNDRLAFPFTKHVCSPNQVDAYVATLGGRKLDFKRARAMLSAAGFTISGVDMDHVVGAAKAVRDGVTTLAGLEGPQADRLRPAVGWILERFDQIGYVDTELEG